MKQLKWILFVLLFFTEAVFSSAVSASSATDTGHIPEPLKQWIPWVLKDNPSIQCPISYKQNKHFCAYPGSLNIKLKQNTGNFQQTWQVFAESWITLPGDMSNWPVEVTVNKKTRPVINHYNKPALLLPKGNYRIKGKFTWQQQPGFISIPKETGLISLNINNKPVLTPDLRNGKLWLKTTVTKTQKKNNRLEIQVFRKVSDTIPLQIDTRIKLDVSGQQREIILQGAILNGFRASAINSYLPAQLEKNGGLKIQVRPGQWNITVSAINTQQLTSIKLDKISTTDPDKKSSIISWPVNEIWVLEQQPQLRLIKVVDKNNIDPNQTQLPQNWKNLPAYNMQAGDQLRFDVIKRGDPEPEPDQLTLDKEIWLDFDGNGFTINDKISGKLSRQWRLNVSSGLDLGQVKINGKPQYITQAVNSNGKNKTGVEVRHGNLKLSADSRINTDRRTLSASGWDIDFNRMNASLNLPPGWVLLAIKGATVNNTWLQQWSLLDLFMVLITAIAIYKLWGVKWGAVSLLALTLSWHQFFAPQFIWINLIIAIAILRALPAGRFYKLVFSYRVITSITLLLIVLPFIVNQARTALYPQLESFNISIDNAYLGNIAPVATKKPAEMPREMVMEEEAFSQLEQRAKRKVVPSKMMSLSRSSSFESDSVPADSLSAGATSMAATPEAKIKKLAAIDPDAMIQTGPGLPSWQLNTYYMTWDGPVSREQTISLTLLSPAMHALLNILRILLILLMCWRLLDLASFKLPESPNSESKNPESKDPGTKNPGQKTKPPKNKDEANTTGATLSSAISALLIGLVFNLSPTSADAAYPSQELLEQLHEELTQQAECLPQCASIESMSINLSARKLHISLRVHAQENLLIPLPLPIKQWTPEKIKIDGKTVNTLIRIDETLWLQLNKGSHRININGRVDYLSQLQFSLPLKPHHIELEIQDWTVEGMDKQAFKIKGLTFLRKADKNDISNDKQTGKNTLLSSTLPVYAKLDRNLELGLDWQLSSQLHAVSGTTYPVTFSVPLLSGESILSEHIKVEDKHAIITLTAKNRSVSWRSRLQKTDQIKLTAINSEQMIETWSLNASPIWHVELSGIPVIYHQRISKNSSSLWLPRWQPWPGESITIDITRPKGIQGKTVTIDSSTLSLIPGEQITAVELNFNLRSSLGGLHTVQLPKNIELQSVSINGQNMPVRNATNGIALPISPGNQDIVIKWNENRGISPFYQSSSINLGIDSVNHAIKIKPGYDRWVLITRGPVMGPAVLFWGMLGVILIIAYALGRIKQTPLSTLQWILLGIGLSASEPWALIIIAGSILALRARGTVDTTTMSRVKFNLFQVMLALFMLFTISTLLGAIQHGLLGSPDMQITGNGSSIYGLNWYSARIKEISPSVTIISVPVYIYRILMLLWSIWLAFALIKWAQWAWTNFTKNEYWRAGRKNG